jgi:hypothetical protein
MIKNSLFNFNIFIKLIKIILKKIFYISNSHIFHNEKPTYETDGLITSHVFGGGYKADGDANFQEALKLGRKEFVHNLYHEWRLYVASMILKMLMQKTNINYIELGVGEGLNLYVYSKYIKYLNNNKINKNFNLSYYYLMDTFTGIDPSLASKEMQKSLHSSAFETYGGSSGTLETIKKRFKFLGNKLKIIPGTIPHTLNKIRKVNFNRPIFLHIDLNNPVPEVASLNFFLKKMKVGDVILFDDYGFSNAKEQRVSINKFFDSRKLSRPLTLPTGQGIYLF